MVFNVSVRVLKEKQRIIRIYYRLQVGDNGCQGVPKQENNGQSRGKEHHNYVKWSGVCEVHHSPI